MASVSDSFRDTMRLFGRHERVATSLLLIVILLVCLHTQVVDGRVLFLVALLVIWPFFQTRLQWLYHRHFGIERSPFPAILLDAVLIGVCISITEFSIAPSLVFASILLLSLMTVQSFFGWVLVAVLCVASMLISAYFFGHTGSGINQTPILVTVTSIIALMVHIVVELVQSRHRVQIAERQLVEAQAKTTHFMNIANKISRYAPSQVWQSILRGDRDARIENKRKKLTIFFSDIQGFTELSETLLPDDLAMILNTYFEHMSELAKKYGGTIDKFIG
ncbi:MAG: adenylate/guanylate cyclase domain-containing protein, partial [Pseudomonadota bacterium]|nr:adenylate/guanylate cyclase domain-containing protein [Pseudomonadota bacterium]